MQLQESGEMYLETIFMLSKKLAAVRSIDVCDEMGYSKPSVSRAVGLLKSGGFITVDKDGFISLTEKGSSVAAEIYDRHNWLATFLVNVGVDPKVAAKDACKIEHYISTETFEALKEYAKNKFGEIEEENRE